MANLIVDFICVTLERKYQKGHGKYHILIFSPIQNTSPQKLPHTTLTLQV